MRSYSTASNADGVLAQASQPCQQPAPTYEFDEEVDFFILDDDGHTPFLDDFDVEVGTSASEENGGMGTNDALDAEAGKLGMTEKNFTGVPENFEKNIRNSLHSGKEHIHPLATKPSNGSAGLPRRCDIDTLQQKLARANVLCDKLLGSNTVNVFADNCATTINDWHHLLCISIKDPSIAAAFRAVDGIITRKRGTSLLRRLAYVQLMQIFTSLESIIRQEHEKAPVQRLNCYRASSVAMDLYVQCQESDLSPAKAREKLKERKRIGRSWVQLAGPSPLLVLLYSEIAEPILNFKKTDRASITMIAARAHSILPRRMVDIANEMTATVVSAAKSNEPLPTSLDQFAGQIKAHWEKVDSAAS